MLGRAAPQLTGSKVFWNRTGGLVRFCTTSVARWFFWARVSNL